MLASRMEKLVEKRQRKRPMDNKDLQDLIKQRVKDEIKKAGEIDITVIHNELVRGRVGNDFEHADIYSSLDRLDDSINRVDKKIDGTNLRIDPFFTEVEDLQETKRLWNKYSKKYTKTIKFIKISLLLLLGAVLDGKDRVIDYLTLLFGRG